MHGEDTGDIVCVWVTPIHRNKTLKTFTSMG